MEKPLTIIHPKDQPHEVNAVAQIETVLRHPRAVAGALCADAHLGYSMPIGGVVAYQDAISPTGVGFDIACGNMAVQTNLLVRDVFPAWPVDYVQYPKADNVKSVMRQIQKKVNFGMGGSSGETSEHELFDREIWTEIDREFGTKLKGTARRQLGTVGSGNHYVDLLRGDDGHLWVANHFGSRGLGHTIASGFMAVAAGSKFNERVAESDEAVVFDTDTEIGQFYIEAMELAGLYAYAGREYVMEQVLSVLGAEAMFSVHNHHNYAWKELGLWVVRKGATPLTTEPAFIGGSMGDVSVICRGKLEPHKVPDIPGRESLVEAARTVTEIPDIGAIRSAPHGAGRVMSRNAAAGKMRKMWVCNSRDCDWTVRAHKDAKHPIATGGEEIERCPKCSGTKFRKIYTRDLSTAKIDWSATRMDLKRQGIVVLGGGADEAPGVYKSLEEVLAAHSNIEVMHRLRPIGVVMAGPDTRDPYRD